MRILVVGGGGREHALAWKLSRESGVTEITCAPGNPGIARIARVVPTPATDLDGLVRLARDERIDLTVVGPELPLERGIVDLFAAEGLRAFGPTRAAAALESGLGWTACPRCRCCQAVKRASISSGFVSDSHSPKPISSP